MASLLFVSSSLNLLKPNSLLHLHQKPNSSLSFSSAHSQARDESHKSVYPLFLQTQVSSRTSTTATRISSDSQNSTSEEVDQTVEHACFLQMKAPENRNKEEYDSFFKAALNSLKCIPGVLYLSAGYVGDTNYKDTNHGHFNFLLHSRHATKKHRDGFVQHKLKFGFQVAFCPDEECTDLLMLDYVYKHSEPLDHPVYGSALRYTFLKLKDGVDESSLYEEISKFFPGSAAPPSFGRLIQPVSSIPGVVHDALKGYNLGIHGAYSSKIALDALGTPQAFAKTLKNKLAGLLVDDKSIFVADFVIDEVYGGTW